MPTRFKKILCADWSKDAGARAVAAADVGASSVRLLRAPQWTLESLLRVAAAEAAAGPVLLGLDLPLGAPTSVIQASSRALGRPEPARFIEWLPFVASHVRFFDPCMDRRDWSPLRPFLRVPSGVEGLKGFERTAADQGVDLYRKVDRLTGAKSLFVTSGIPGSVGSSVLDVWPNLTLLRAKGPAFALWPTETTLEEDGPSIVVGETYPRALYGLALGTAPPGGRGRLTIPKTNPNVRTAALQQLRAHEWTRARGVTLENVEEASGNEDAFDAMMSAAGLLRCLLEDTPLGWSGADPHEGGILACDSLDFSQGERMFTLKPDGAAAAAPGKPAAASIFLDRPQSEWVAQNAHAFALRDAFPVSPGHTLVVTRRVVPTWFDATPAERTALLALVDVVKQQLDRGSPRPDGYNVGFDVGAAAGQAAPHLHVHVVPRYAGEPDGPRGGMRHVVPPAAGESSAT